MNILDIIGESLLVIGGMKDRAERSKRVAELLKLVGCAPNICKGFPMRLAVANASVSS